MSDTIIADGPTLDWGIAVRDAFLLERERVKHLPEFIEWAENTVRSDAQTENGWIPGWTMDDCARRWVEHNGVDLPACPIPVPSWAQAREVKWDGNEVSVTDSTIVTVEDVVLHAQRMTSLVIDTGDWPDGSRTDCAGELFTDSDVYVIAGKEIEISAATPEKLRNYSIALALLADGLTAAG